MHKLIIVIILLLVLFTLFVLTNPQNSPALILITPFIGIFVILFFLINGYMKARVKGQPIQVRKRATAMAALLSLVPVILAALASLGQLTLRDAITIVVLGLVLAFYISRFSFAKE